MNRREAIQRTAMMLGYAVSASAIAGVLEGCKASPELAFKPVFLSEDVAKLVAEVAEIIIPKTETPGAKDVGVPGFIDLMLKDCYKKEDQDRFLKGATDFDADAKATYGDIFVDCDAEKQKELVYKYHSDAVAAMKSDAPPKDKPFILMVKELTMLGFFTSEPGATQVLQYQAVPGTYKGCVPLSEVGRTWAT
jgi:gluconate 2-dehydrogenase gamma chain